MGMQGFLIMNFSPVDKKGKVSELFGILVDKDLSIIDTVHFHNQERSTILSTLKSFVTTYYKLDEVMVITKDPMQFFDLCKNGSFVVKDVANLRMLLMTYGIDFEEYFKDDIVKTSYKMLEIMDNQYGQASYE